MLTADAAPRERSAEEWAGLAAEIERLWLSDPPASLRRAEQWLAAEREAGSAEGQARALRSHGYTLRFVGQHEAALAAYEEAERHFRKLGLEAEVNRTCVGHTTTLRLLGRYAEALSLGQRSLASLRAHGDELYAGRQAMNLGTIYRPLGRLREALQAYQEARSIARRFEDWVPLATTEQNIGNVLVDLGQYERALRHLRRAERIRRRLGLKSELAYGLMNIGILLHQRGDYGEALTAFGQARAIYAALDLQVGVTLVDRNLLLTYAALNLHTEGLATAERTIAGYRALEMPWELGQALLAAGRLAEAAGQSERAGEHVAEARRLFARTGNPLCEALARLEQGRMAARGGDVARCRALLQLCRSATRRLETAGASDRSALGRLVEGALLARLGRPRQALERFRQVVALASELGADHLLYEAYAAIGELHEASDPIESGLSNRRAIEHLELVRARAPADDLKLAFVENKSDLYERLVGLLIANGTRQALDEAYGVVQRSTSRTLVEEILSDDRGGGRGRRNRVGRPARRVRDLQAHLNAVYAQAYGAEAAPTADGMVRSGQAGAVAQLEDEYARATRELQLVARAEQPRPEAELTGPVAATWYVPDGTTLVEYYGVGSDLVAFVKVGCELSLIRVAALDDVVHLAERLRLQLRHAAAGSDYLLPHLARFRRMIEGSLQALWEAVVAPLAEHLGGRERLLVVPHGPLHGLPFHAFHDGAAYVAERHTISYAPSAAVYRAGLRQARSPGERAVVVGVEDPGLPWVAGETAAVADAWPTATVLTGRRATARALRRQAGRFDVLHLATHAVFRADNPMFSSIKLADAWLTVADLGELARGAQLVTLSACETGVGGLAGADEVLGLTRGILGAGCSTVVASLWTVADETTARLMVGFYRELRQGRPPAEALRSSMLAVRNDFDHPYFWAPFAVIGGSA